LKQFVLPFEPSEGHEEPGEYELEGRDFHYLVHVRRYSAGDRVPARSPAGRACTMSIVSVGRTSCRVALDASSDTAPTRSETVFPRLALMPAVTRGRKMDLVIRQAVEAGAVEIRPLLSRHCQVKLPGEGDRQSRKQRWDRIAVEALQQCGGSRPAVVDVPRPLEEVLELWNHRGPLLFLHESRLSSASLHERLAEPVSDLAIMVGPEGGFSPGEADRLRSYGAIPIHLGDRVLRAETAALYGLAAVSTIIREKDAWQPA